MHGNRGPSSGRGRLYDRLKRGVPFSANNNTKNVTAASVSVSNRTPGIPAVAGGTAQKRAHPDGPTDSLNPESPLLTIYRNVPDMCERLTGPLKGTKKLNMCNFFPYDRYANETDAEPIERGLCVYEGDSVKTIDGVRTRVTGGFVIPKALAMRPALTNAKTGTRQKRFRPANNIVETVDGDTPILICYWPPNFVIYQERMANIRLKSKSERASASNGQAPPKKKQRRGSASDDGKTATSKQQHPRGKRAAIVREPEDVLRAYNHPCDPALFKRPSGITARVPLSSETRRAPVSPTLAERLAVYDNANRSLARALKSVTKNSVQAMDLVENEFSRTALPLFVGEPPSPYTTDVEPVRNDDKEADGQSPTPTNIASPTTTPLKKRTSYRPSTKEHPSNDSAHKPQPTKPPAATTTTTTKTPKARKKEQKSNKSKCTAVISSPPISPPTNDDEEHSEVNIDDTPRSPEQVVAQKHSTSSRSSTKKQQRRLARHNRDVAASKRSSSSKKRRHRHRPHRRDTKSSDVDPNPKQSKKHRLENISTNKSDPVVSRLNGDDNTNKKTTPKHKPNTTITPPLPPRSSKPLGEWLWTLAGPNPEFAVPSQVVDDKELAYHFDVESVLEQSVHLKVKAFGQVLTDPRARLLYDVCCWVASMMTMAGNPDTLTYLAEKQTLGAWLLVAADPASLGGFVGLPTIAEAREEEGFEQLQDVKQRLGVSLSRTEARAAVLTDPDDRGLYDIIRWFRQTSGC